MSEVALLPCPFCGSADVDPKFAYFQRPAEEGGGTYGHEPGCMKCGASAPAEIWNRRQSLSQEAVRDEALEDLSNLVKVLEDVHDSHKRKGLPLTDSQFAKLNRARSTLRALKREPNAAGRATGREQSHAAGDGQPDVSSAAPAPAAPDVAEVLSDWRVVAEFFASRNWPDTKLGDAASRLHARLPALLAKLGQGGGFTPDPTIELIVDKLCKPDRNETKY